MVEQQRFARLNHLLKQSSLYSDFLVKRMQTQELEKQKMKEKEKEKEKGSSKKEKKGFPVSRYQYEAFPSSSSSSFCVS